MKTDIFETAARYAAHLARLSRQPKRIKLTHMVSGNQEQECARRRRFYERHWCAVGGGPLWDGPTGSKVGTVIVGEAGSVEINVNG